jgi:putative transposase
MAFAHNQLAIGKILRILTVDNTHSQFCTAADPRFTYHGEDVVQTLEKVCANIGYPKTISVDNGSEFIFRRLDLWAYANDVTLDFPRSGKPTDNGFILRRGKPSPGLVADPSSHSTASFGPNA